MRAVAVTLGAALVLLLVLALAGDGLAGALLQSVTLLFLFASILGGRDRRGRSRSARGRWSR